MNQTLHFIQAHWSAGLAGYVALAFWRALPKNRADFNWYDWVKTAGDSLTNTPNPPTPTFPK